MDTVLSNLKAQLSIQWMMRKKRNITLRDMPNSNVRDYAKIKLLHDQINEHRENISGSIAARRKLERAAAHAKQPVAMGFWQKRKLRLEEKAKLRRQKKLAKS